MRLFDGSAPVRTLAASAALLFGLLMAAPGSLRADQLDDDVKAMRELEKAGPEKEDECIAKMDLVKAGRDLRAYAAIKDMIASKSDKIACAAVMDLAVTWHDGDFFRWLVGKVDDKELAKQQGGRPELYKCVIDAVRTYPPGKVKSALKQLGDAVNRYLTSEPEYAERAIRTYGTVPDRFTVQQLLDWLGQLKSAAGPSENKERARKAILETLNQLCGQEIADAVEWKKWWDANGKKFKFPEAATPATADGARPAAPPAAATADPSALTEFKDEAYGYSVKKPEGATWKFFKPDYAGPRVGLVCFQEGSETSEEGRAYFSVHDPAKFEPRDIKAFAAWVLGTVFKEQLDTEGMPQPPETKEMKIGGTDWTVVIARGRGLGANSGWGTMERRYYLTKLGAYILYVDSWMRLSAYPEDKTALWACIEAIAITPKK